MNLASPLWRLRSLKTKLSIVIVGAVGIAAMTSTIGFRLGWPIWVRPVVASAVALVVVQFVARGMTRPLREIDAAARQLSAGDRSVRVTPTTQDEIGRLGASFNAMADELEATEENRRRFIADAAHELRTPVSGLLAMTENLEEGIARPTAETLSNLHQQCQRLSVITKDLLDLSRLENDTVQLSPEPIDVDELLASSLQDARRRHPDLVTVHDTAEPRLVIHGDLGQLRRAVDNVIENAAIHGRVGDEPPKVTAGASLSNDREPTVSLVVSDSGPGFGPAPNEVFERFHRRAAPDRPGTGLGLAIVRQIVHRHGGSVHAGDAGPGAAVTIELPADRLA